jgi:hypothetical protein
MGVTPAVASDLSSFCPAAGLRGRDRMYHTSHGCLFCLPALLAAMTSWPAASADAAASAQPRVFALVISETLVLPE